VEPAAPGTAQRSVLRGAWWRLIRFGFWLLYNEMAFTYDAVSRVVSLGQWDDWQRTALHHLNTPPGAPVLELAHGTGNLQLELHAAGYRAAALDLSHAMGHLARRKLRRAGIVPLLVRARGQAIPFPALSFSTVVSTFPTEFIMDRGTLAEVFRVLRPGGRLVVVVSGVLTRGGAARDVLELAYRATGQRAPWPVNVEQRLAEAGFRSAFVSEALERSTVLLVVADKAGTIEHVNHGREG
jgi:ubiquinone/menaquinone biosynthesis C-methylase UbiE